jgi:hypothetical protein
MLIVAGTFERHEGETGDWCSICKRHDSAFVDVSPVSRTSRGEGQVDLERGEDGDVPGDYLRVCSRCVAHMVRSLENFSRARMVKAPEEPEKAWTRCPTYEKPSDT